MIVLWLFVLLGSLNQFYCAQSDAISTQEQGPLLLETGPKYYGLTNIGNLRVDSDHFTKHSLIDFDSAVDETFLSKFCDDNFLQILSFLDDFRFLVKLSFSSKRLFRLLSKHVSHRYTAFNPRIFWSLPSSAQLNFGLKLLNKFEKTFPGLKYDVSLPRDELTGLILLVFHLDNPHYISPSSIRYTRACNPYYYTSDINKNSLINPPLPSPDVWKTILISRFVKMDSFYCIEAACRADPTKIDWTMDLIARKLGETEKTKNEQISVAMRSLLYELITLSPDDFKLALNALLFKSVIHETISTFTAFLPLWTYPLAEMKLLNHQVLSPEIGTDHIIYRIAYFDLTCPELLERTDLSQEILAKTLKLCKSLGNWRFATDLIMRFPPNTFSAFFDAHHIDILRQTLSNLANQVVDFGLSLNAQLNMALLISSFHFQQPQIINLFSRFIVNQHAISDEFLEKLKLSRSAQFYKLALQGRRRTNNCIMS